jgi:CHASE3 domain sensor protein
LLIGATLAFLISNISVVVLAEFQLNMFQEESVTIEKMCVATKSLLIGLLGAEAGARGYLITANEIYLSPYYAGLASIQDQMRVLSLLSLDEAQGAKGSPRDHDDEAGGRTRQYRRVATGAGWQCCRAAA